MGCAPERRRRNGELPPHVSGLSGLPRGRLHSTARTDASVVTLTPYPSAREAGRSGRPEHGLPRATPFVFGLALVLADDRGLGGTSRIDYPGREAPARSSAEISSRHCSKFRSAPSCKHPPLTHIGPAVIGRVARGLVVADRPDAVRKGEFELNTAAREARAWGAEKAAEAPLRILRRSRVT